MSRKKTRAAFWWIDRWRKSTAYTDMTAEEQGLYRNLLDELWLRDGLLPTKEKALAQISGDAEAWTRCRSVVLERFEKTPDGYRHPTHDEVALQGERYRASQEEKGRKRAETAARGPDGKMQSGHEQNHVNQPEDQPKDQPEDQPRKPASGFRSSNRYRSLSPEPEPEEAGADAPSAREARGRAQASARGALEAEFEGRFWPEVPHKVAKGAAKKAFAKARKKHALEDILAGLPVYRARERVREENHADYRPLHPATWLNGERWTDEPPRETTRGMPDRTRNNVTAMNEWLRRKEEQDAAEGQD